MRGDHDYLLDHTNIKAFDQNISQIKFTGSTCLASFVVIYLSFYLLDLVHPNIYVFLFESFFRIGSLSFGEGHVLIPMILTEYSNDNLLEESDVLNGYALISLLPGSMFNMAAYSGVFAKNILGGIIANIAIFVPGFLFLFASFPYIDKIKSSNFFQFFIRGANSAAIGFVFTAAVKLWIDSCFLNPYAHPIIGTLNICVCFILFEAFGLQKPFIILFGAIFIFLLTYLKIGIESSNII
jgi:chromate transporter